MVYNSQIDLGAARGATPRKSFVPGDLAITWWHVLCTILIPKSQSSLICKELIETDKGEEQEPNEDGKET